MCLLLLSWQPEAAQRLVVLANRDEFYDRPTRQANFWSDVPGLLAGRDERGGGTWLGIDRNGRFAAVTNFRSPQDMNSGGVSRGGLPVNFLSGSDSAMEYLGSVAERGADYAGFNLLVFDGNELCYFSNRSDEDPVILSSGIYGLSNALLNTPWPKVESGRDELRQRIKSGAEVGPAWLDIMGDTSLAADHELPDTGVGHDLEKQLSARCIQMDGYGTRCSTFVSIGSTGGDRVHFEEKTHVPVGLEHDTVSFTLE